MLKLKCLDRKGKWGQTSKIMCVIFSFFGLWLLSPVCLRTPAAAQMASRGGASRPNGPNSANKICQFKLVLLGESAVGKSSLVLRFVKGQFHEFQESTIGGMSL